METSDLRELIAQSQPSVVLSRARASLRSPSRPSTPLVDARSSVVPAADWKTLGRKNSLPVSTLAQRKANRQSGLRAASASPAPRAPPDHGSADPETKTRDDRVAVTLAETTGHDALVALQQTVLGMRGGEDIITDPSGSVWDQIGQVSALARASDHANEAVLAECDSLVPVLVSCTQRTDASISARLSAARMIACLCPIPSFVERQSQHVETMARVLCSAATEAAQDVTFRESRLLESLVQYVIPACADRLRSGSERAAQILLLVVCAMKNVCAENDENQSALARYGAISLLSEVIDLVVPRLGSKSAKHSTCEGKCSEGSAVGHRQACALASETAALLRCLVDDKRRLQQFASARVAFHLCKCLRRSPEEGSLVLNCARVLSRLSASKRTRDGLDCEAMLGALEATYETQLAAGVRLCFALGNLTTESAEARLQVSHALAGRGADVAVRLLCFHSDQYVRGRSEMSRKDRKEQEDLLIKAVRLVANLAIEEDVGKALARNDAVGAAVTGLLRTLLSSHARELSSKQEELALNLVACTTNLSYYCDALTGGMLRSSELLGPSMVPDLLPFVFAENAEAVQEAVRALANFSRLPEMRETMVRSRAAEAVVLLLEHSDREVVLSACGALTNLVADEQVCELLIRLGGVKTLIGRLRQGGVSDAELSLRCSMALYNVASRRPSAMQPYVTRLQDTLEQLVEVARELASESSSADVEDESKAALHDKDDVLLEFAQVGEKLHELLHSSLFA